MDALWISGWPVLVLALLVGYLVVKFWRELLVALLTAVFALITIGALDVAQWMGGRL